ncbi:MobV family relaxase [Chromobacterium violaceum]|uniref:MobV family relaxase n=1 Tax=Chromobacterium violaceum TaxID=536 RepID=UPI0009BC04B2|nr:MobV family relaxase [Chromobacterium violaceum]
MKFAILRTQKLKHPQAVRRSLMHAFREQETPNADPRRTQDNSHFGAANVAEALERFNSRLPDKVRKNAVLAIEYLVTASPEVMQGKSRSEQDAYFADALKWMRVRHGAENVVYAGIHRDETTPHMYAYVVPLDERGKLNCRSFLGGAKALSEMQTDFAKRVGQLHGLDRGLEGSKARHTTIQAYYARANAAFEPLPLVETPAPKLRPEPEKPGLFAANDTKRAYQLDHDAWLHEKALAERQQEQRRQEIKAQRDAATQTARRHEAQAQEAKVLRTKLDEQKNFTSRYVQKATKLEAELATLKGVVNLFSPSEIQAAQERQHQEAAERAQRLEAARQKAADEAYRTEVAEEVQRRIEALPKLLRTNEGPAYMLAKNAIAELTGVGGDPDKVDWRAMELATAREAIAEHGQHSVKVSEVLTRHSPGLADPELHALVCQSLERVAHKWRAEYEQAQAKKLGSRQHGPG